MPIDAQNSKDGVDRSIDMIVDPPIQDVSGLQRRAWVTRVIVTILAGAAVYVLYIAYTESSRLRERELAIEALESSTKSLRAEHSSLIEKLAGLREESSNLSDSVGTARQELDRLSYELREAKRTIAAAEQKSAEIDQAGERLASISAEIEASSERQNLLKREIQSLEARRKTDSESLDKVRELLELHSATIVEQQPLVTEVNKLRPERDALRSEIERMRSEADRLSPLLVKVEEQEARHRNLEPRVAELQASADSDEKELKAIRIELDQATKDLTNVRIELARVNAEEGASSKQMASQMNALSALEKERIQLEKEVEEAMALRDELSGDLARQRKASQTVNVEFESQKLEQASAVNKLKETEDRLETASSKLNTIRPELAKLEERRLALIREIELLTGIREAAATETSTEQ